MDDAVFEELCRMADAIEGGTNGRADDNKDQEAQQEQGDEDDGFGLLLQLASEAQQPAQSPPKRHTKCIAMPPSKASSSHSLLSKVASKEAGKPQAITEAYAGIRVRNPVVPLPTLQDRLQSSVFFQLKDVRSAAGAVGLDGQWATLGVLSQRALPRESDAGKVYSIAKGTVLSLVLFGRAHEAFYREPEGMVVAVFDANPKRGGGGGASGFSVSVSQARQVLVVGRCPDFGTCKALRKDGQPCRMPVNISQCPYCEYHVASQYKAMQLKVAPQFADNNLMTAYRPAMHHNRNGSRGGMGDGMGDGGDGRPVARVRRMGSQEIRDVAQRCGSGSNGARLLQSVAARLDAEEEEATIAIAPSCTSNQHKAGQRAKHGTAQHSAEELAARARAVEIMRQLGGVRGTTSSQTTSSSNPPTTTHPAKRPRQHSPTRQHSPIRDAAPARPRASASAPPPKPTSSFAAAFGAAAAGVENAEGSRYAGLATGAEHERLGVLMEGLAEKDAVAEKMASITNIRISERRYPECRDHHVTRVTSTKRWWTCSTCKYHFSTVGSKYPAHACRKCNDGGARFVRASMYKGGASDRHAPGENLVASRDKLLVRGVEHGFSLK